MRSGGYQIIDLQNKQLTLGTGMVYPGIYEQIEATNKVKLVSGLNIAGTEYDDCWVNFTVTGSNFVGAIDGYTITVEDTDVVTVQKKT